LSGAAQSLGRRIRQAPRSATALALGVSTATVTHFAWHADARTSGIIPAITLGAGLAHAIAGAITGPRLFDPARTHSTAQAALLGALTSLLALVFFAPPLALYVTQENTQPSLTSYVALTVLTAVFAFLAAGWALLLVSAGVTAGLHRIASETQA